MTIYDLKPKFQNLLRPISRTLDASGITPNPVTVAALILSIAGGLAVFRTGASPRSLFLIPVVLFLRMALNAVDGMLAKERDAARRNAERAW